MNQAERHEPLVRAAFTFDTEDIRAAQQALMNQGVETSSIQEYSDHRAFTFQDCDGNALMVCQF